MGRVKLAKLSTQSFEHEADRAALDALKKTVGFDRLIRSLARMGIDREIGVLNKCSHVQCGPKQVPSLWKLFAEVCETLDLEPPALYLANSAEMNAFTIGIEKPVIVLSSALVAGMTDAEIQSVMGHELGHVLAGHTLYRVITENIRVLLLEAGDLAPGVGPLLKLTVLPALMYWYRCSELTADRCGLLAIQEPRPVFSCQMKLAGGSAGRFSEELDLEAFLEQARECPMEEDTWSKIHRAILEQSRTHPWTVVRAREIEKWVASGSYQKILAGEYVRRASASVADGPHPSAGKIGEAGCAAQSEVAICSALARAYGVHVAPRIPETQLGLALGAYAELMPEDERVVALYDDTFSGAGDRGILLTNRRIFSHSRPRKGIRYAEIARLEDLPGSLVSRPGLLVEDLEIRFHTRDMRDAFKTALAAAVEVFRAGV